MNEVVSSLEQRLKQRLAASIAAQIDLIAHVPGDLARMIGDKPIAAAANSPGEVPAHGRSVSGDRTDNAGVSNLDRLATHVNSFYDEAFYSREGIMGILLGSTQYRNIGYWDETTTTQHAASERLQDILLDFIPEKRGRILDVACGMGASTRRLLDFYPADDVWAINISEKQIASTAKNAPGCHAQVMNAVAMTFEDGFFDNVMCIEAAFHFQTRRKFLEEVMRVLKPGGRLVLSDVLFTSAARLEQYDVFPGKENHLADAAEYRELL